MSKPTISTPADALAPTRPASQHPSTLVALSNIIVSRIELAHRERRTYPQLWAAISEPLTQATAIALRLGYIKDDSTTFPVYFTSGSLSQAAAIALRQGYIKDDFPAYLASVDGLGTHKLLGAPGEVRVNLLTSTAPGPVDLVVAEHAGELARVREWLHWVGVRTATPAPAVGAAEGVDWKVVQRELLAKRKRGEKFRSCRTYAQELGCAVGTIHKAITKSEPLRGWQARAKTAAPRAKSLNAREVDNAVQSREPNPADQVADNDEVGRIMDYLIDMAKDKPEQLAELEAMDEEQRREMAKAYAEQRKDARQWKVHPVP
jgi:hypothetical protein